MTDDVRKGVSQAALNEKGYVSLGTQILAISIGLGIWFSSWWVFGGTFLGLLTLILIKPIAIILAFVMGIGAGVAAWHLMGILFSTSAQWVVGIIVGMAMTGWNMAGIQWAQDIADS